MRSRYVLVALLAAAMLPACSNEGPSGNGLPPPPPPRGASAPRGELDAGADVEKRAEFQEQDFVETERNRDPFRSYIHSLTQAAQSTTKQREVMLDRYSIDELKLVGIVTGGTEHRAMVVDPTGKGWIIRRGQFIGKEEVVHGKGASGADYALNWRVDRIRDGDIVLVREDPAHADVPPATRVIPLRPDTEAANR